MHLKLTNNKSVQYWTTSDLHFGHANVIRYSNRPFNSVEEMDASFISNWNDKVSPNDIVFNLGDFAFSNTNRIIEILSQLNGEQYFIYGNHDRLMKSDAVQNFCKRTKKIRLFADVIECRYKTHSLFMSHYSHRVWNKAHYGAMHLYGHSHGKLPGIGRSMDVGVDSGDMQSGYAPFLLDDVVKHLENKAFTLHH